MAFDDYQEPRDHGLATVLHGCPPQRTFYFFAFGYVDGFRKLPVPGSLEPGVGWL
jgi:hypothetical protein